MDISHYREKYLDCLVPNNSSYDVELGLLGGFNCFNIFYY